MRICFSAFTPKSAPRILIFVLLFLLPLLTLAQRKSIVRGQVTDQAGEPLVSASVVSVAAGLSTATDSKGFYSLTIPVGTDQLEIQVSYIGFKTMISSIKLEAGKVQVFNFVLESQAAQGNQIDIQERSLRFREQAGLTRIDPRLSKFVVSPFGDFTRLLATLPGVVSNNELSSSYAVRGGGYDENLVYVNDIEIYRPFLARAGQQEGLSFINPDLIKNVDFSSGGWQPRFGDKLSSVLSAEYKQPQKFGGSFSAGFLTQNLHLEAASPGGRISFIGGVRRKSAQYLFQDGSLAGLKLFKGLEVQGQYFPQFTDIQTYTNINLLGISPSQKRADSLAGRYASIGILVAYARNNYLIYPESRESSFGTAQRVLRLSMGFSGQEQMRYNTIQAGIDVKRGFNLKWKTSLTASLINTNEREKIDVEGAYRLCDVETDPSKDNFNKCVFERGFGSYFNYARNRLDAQIFQTLHRVFYQPDSLNKFEAGWGFSHEQIKDQVQEYSFIDSADFVSVIELVNASNQIQNQRLTAYGQHHFYLGRLSTTYGLRLNHSRLNGQTFVSPRLQLAYQPDWQSDWVFKFAAGHYGQSPFYREMRDFGGQLNTNLRAQNSYHFIGGADHVFKIWNRPFNLTSEIYYKHMSQIVPYDLDNVRLRYYAQNIARAYAYGADLRIAGEFIKGAESWFSFGYLQTKENVPNDSLNIFNSDGILSGRSARGYLRRPTDQRLTFSAFFQDHLPNNPTARVYLSLIVGTGLPFGPPADFDNRAVFRAPAYRRVDIGFSKIIMLREKNAFKHYRFDSIWLGLDILNVLGVQNTISYLWIKDVFNSQFAVPNTLSARFINAKVNFTF